MSKEPCRWCGETYQLITPCQIHHKQSDWCWKQHRALKQALGDKARRAKSKATRPVITARTPRISPIQHPLSLAIWWAKRHGYGALYRRYREDVLQEIYLALFSYGVTDPIGPWVGDINGLLALIKRHLYQLAKSFGWRRIDHSISHPVPLERSLSALGLADRFNSLSAWQAAWRHA